MLPLDAEYLPSDIPQDGQQNPYYEYNGLDSHEQYKLHYCKNVFSNAWADTQYKSR